jgi:hypothetical protein
MMNTAPGTSLQVGLNNKCSKLQISFGNGAEF